MVALGAARAQQRARPTSTTGAGESAGKASSQPHESGRFSKRSNDGDGSPNSPLRPTGSPESPPTAPNIDRVSSPSRAMSGAGRGRGMRGRGRKLVASRAVKTRNSLTGSLLHTQLPDNEEPAKAAPSCSSSSGPDQCDTPEKPEKPGGSRKAVEVEPGHSAGSQSSPCPAEPRGPSGSPAGDGMLSRQADAVGDSAEAGRRHSHPGGSASAGTAGIKRPRITFTTSLLPPEVGAPP